MRIYELCEVNNNPRKNDCKYYDHKVYNNSLYLEAETNVECNLEKEVTDEEFDNLVEKELENIIETLKVCGRYPENGIPKYVMW